ncbi:P-loop ATPase, Sll1717 family [Jeotgalibacillus haloalkalitolerans]|uniref:S1 RNA-binding domain-containing protein n=1 Tax=Jeotgalibacillus haloalkalitolerans TaxID=3104292 RepID=A0ABU5KJ86_9BACL|nr:S1 RNA-binding domain-containing protein [Jeotgalibacillus sp. HH7-29]MDZ5711320.1 S1 RNA-binding domain-containing protein [Jeotgalibacillus sp. HH7-29]
MYQVLEIKDIFIGSIDAKDDVNNAISNNEFIESFIMPPKFDIDEFLVRDKCFVEGYKGTGKTALLHYMSKYAQGESAYDLFILFKSHYKFTDKEKLENLAAQQMEFDKNSLKDEMDFEYIWRWVILNKIVELNVINDYKVFQKDKDWDRFEKFIKSFNKKSNSKSFFDVLPFKLNKVSGIGYSVQLPDTNLMHTIGIQDMEFSDKNTGYIEFSQLLNKAIELFCKLNFCNKNSYIFIDELEAFYEESEIFKRDLRMIRDLILTVKYFNDLFSDLQFKNLKIICAVRTEVLESIKKHVAAKEINKVIYSFKKELKWNYSNTNAYQHPIIQIWLKRIKMAEKKINNQILTDAGVMDKWFDKKIDSYNIIPYILDHSWHKPRDVVRYLQAAENNSSHKTRYDRSVFDQLRKEYSKESWKEIFEELNILYTPEEIELIRDFLVFFKRHFSVEEAKERANNLSIGSTNKFLRENIDSILKDLYRVGCIGNMTSNKKYYRWQHKGDDGIVLTDPDLLITVHVGLWSELSLFNNPVKTSSMVGKVVKCKVKGWNKFFVYVDIPEYRMEGSIHISKLSNSFVKEITTIISEGEEFNAKLIEYDAKHGWQLTRKF